MYVEAARCRYNHMINCHQLKVLRQMGERVPAVRMMKMPRNQDMICYQNFTFPHYLDKHVFMNFKY